VKDWRVRVFMLGVLVIGWLPASGQAGCDAYYRFDGDLSDATGNGHDGTMISAGGGPAGAAFGEGIEGRSLHLDGTAAMRAYLDLNADLCPQVTITGWIRVEANDITATQYLISTGDGSGPGLRSNGTTAVLEGTGNGLAQRSAIRDGRAWFFFAGVWDYGAGTYRFQFRERTISGELADSRYPAEDAFWVGAYNDRMDYAMKGAYLDELRVIGRALSPAEISKLRGGRPAAFVRSDGATDSRGGAAAVLDAGTSIPQPVSGVSGRTPGIAGEIDPDSLPDRPPLLLGDTLKTSESGSPLLEAPEGLGAGNDAGDPGLQMPDGLPGQQFQDDLAVVQESGLEKVLEQRIEEGERNFGPRDRTQVVLDINGQVAYAGIPDVLLVNKFGIPYEIPDGLTPTIQTDTQIPSSALPEPLNQGTIGDVDVTPDIREVFRFRGTNAYMIVRSNGETQILGDTESSHGPVASRIRSIFNNGRTVDLVANNGKGYLIVSGTVVHVNSIPADAGTWAESELADGVQVTAFAFLPGDAWIGVSRRTVQSGGLTSAHWGMDLLNDVRRLFNSGETIHDISTTSASGNSGSWAIATDRQILYHQQPADGDRFPSCRDYQLSNDDYEPGKALPVEFGQQIETELRRDWSCWYPKLNCLAKYPTWSETNMSSPASASTWDVNLMVTIAVPSYEGIEKEIVDCWLHDQLSKTEAVFRHQPALKVHLRTEFKQSIDGKDLVFYQQESNSDHKQFMDRHFDVMAKSKTEGYYPIFVTQYPCVGYKDDGSRYCSFSRSTFPHWVDPLTRKHGILLQAERSREEVLGHEFGHYFSLKHTFEHYVNLEGDLNCNERYTPKGGDVKCNSCLSPGTVTSGVCSGTYNVMDYCDGDVDKADLNYCQQLRAVNQRQRYMTNEGQTNYAKMKGNLGEPYCRVDSDCLDDEYCNTGVLTVGANYCRQKLSSGAACSRGGQCESGRCPFLACD